MNIEFKEFFVGGFKPTLKREVDVSVINKYSGVLPDNLLGIWQIHGWSGYFNGRFWVVNPDEYQGILLDYINGTDIQGKGDYYCIAKSAFGDLIAFERNSGAIINVNCVFGNVALEKNLLGTSASDFEKEEIILSYFVMFNQEDYGYRKDGKDLFDDVFAKLGHLKHDEIYGFEPLLSLGGKADSSHVAKLNDKVHLSLIRQFSNVVIRYF